MIEHPDSGLPTWFCNVHSHSAMLRDERDGVLPETTGASKLNKSDVFYGVCVWVGGCAYVCALEEWEIAEGFEGVVCVDCAGGAAPARLSCLLACAAGDGSPISTEDLRHIDEVTKRNQVFVAMKEGDVVLVDNYRTMHGRNIFEGTRKHAVTWFK